MYVKSTRLVWISINTSNTSNKLNIMCRLKLLVHFWYHGEPAGNQLGVPVESATAVLHSLVITFYTLAMYSELMFNLQLLQVHGPETGS